MAKKVKDITETGPGALKGIRNPDLYPSKNNPIDSAFSPEQLASIQGEAGRAIYRNYDVAHGHIGYEGLSNASLYTPENIQYSEQGLGSYGNSSYDQGLLLNPTNEDVQNKRAYEQSWFTQLGAGVAKGAVLAGTTYVDGVAGTIAGLINVGVNAAQGNIDSWTTGFNKFIDNPFSNAMQQINDGVEKLLPNYYSTEEQNSPWYTNIFTANFIGDKFLKNLGFTVGAAYSGKTVALGASKALKLNKIREAFKGAVMTASGETLTDANAIAKAYFTGDAIMDGVKITEDLAKAAKKMRRADMAIKTIGAVSAASGEGRIEAIQGSKEWAKLHEQQLEDNRQQEYKQAELQLLQEHPEYFSIDVHGRPQLTSYEGQAALANMRKSIDDKFDQGMAKINEDKAKMANVIFSLNLPLLAVGNAYQFGKFIAGGYNSGRLSKNLVTGSFKEGFKANKNPAKIELVKAIGSPLWEAQEEMSQQMIQEIAGAKYASELNSFYGKKIDPEAERSTIDWLKATGIGFMKSYGDSKQWEQGFIGGLTGLLGVPSIHLRNKEGKFRPNITNEGELYEGIRKFREKSKLAEETAAKLNSKNYINLYRGKIRDKAIQNDLDEYLEKGDKFNFKTSETGQLLSHVMMMDNAGRLPEFLEEIDAAGEISIEEAENIKASASKEDGSPSFMDRMSADQVQTHVKKQAEKFRKIAESYSKISNDLKALYGDNIDQDFLEELTWNMTQIDDMESRGQEMLKNIRTQFQDKAKELKDRFGVDIDVVLNKYGDLEEAFSKDKNLLKDIQDIIADKNNSIQEQNAKISQRIKESQDKVNTYASRLGNAVRHIKTKRKQVRKRLAELESIYRKGAERTFENIDKRDYAEALKEQFEKDAKDIVKEFGNLNYHHVKHQEALNREIESLKELYTEEVDKNTLPSEVTNELNAIADSYKRQYSATEASPVGTTRQVYKGLDSKGNPIYETKAANGKSAYEISAEDRARTQIYQERDSLMSQIIALQEMLNDPNNKLISPLLTQKLEEDFTDLLKIVAMRRKFINDYNSLSEHPEQFTENAIKQAKTIIKHYQEEIINKMVKDLDGVETIEELKEKIGDLEGEELDMLLEKVEGSDNAKLKSLVKEYQKIAEFKSIMDSIFENESANPDTISAANIIYDAIDNASSFKDILKTIKTAVDDPIIPEAVKSKIDEYLNRYEEIKKSKKATEKDTKTPKKKTKESKKKKDSEKEDDEDDGIDDENEEEDVEGEEEAPKPKKKKRFSLEDLPEEPGTGAMEIEEATTGVGEPIEETPIEEEPKTEPFEDVVTLDNLNDYLSSLDDSGLDTIANTLFTSTTALEKSMVINLGEEVPRTKTTLDTIQNAAKEELNKRKKARKTAREEAEKRAEEARKRREAKLKPKKKVRIKDSSTEEDKKPVSIIDMVQDLSDEELQKVISGEVELDGVSDKEKKAFVKLAKAELESRTMPGVGEGGDEATASAEDEDRYSPNDSMRSWRVAQYEFNSLSNRSRRKAVVWKSPMVKILQQLGAFEFVDNGSLGTLFNDNPDIPIHFVLSYNDVFKDTPLLAIEITKEVTDLVKPIRPITIKDSEGKEHQYQIIGTLYHNNTPASKSNYNKVLRNLKDELQDEKGNLNASYKVSEQSHTQIRHLYSGRFVKSDKKSDVEFRTLKSIMNGEKPHLYIYYNPTQSFTTVPKTEAIVPLNSNNQNPREGSIWLATKEADGRYYLKALKVARFNTYDLDKYKDSALVQRLLQDIRDICNSELSDYERSLAKYDLEKVLHFPDNHKLLFNGDSISIANYEDNIGGDLDAEDKAEELLEALQDDELSLRFNINPAEMDEEDYIQDILDADILTTDILYPHNVNASFDVYLVDDEGNPIISEEESTGHTGRLGINSALSYTTIIHNGEEYSIDDDNNIYDKEGDLVSNQDLIDEIKFNQQIRDGEVNPEKGTNLYIGHHKDGSKFGVVNYKTVSEERMTEILEKAKKKKKRETEEDTLDDIEETPKKKNKARSAIERLFASEEDDLDDIEEDEYEERDIFGGKRTDLRRSEDDTEDDEYKERDIFGIDEDEDENDDSEDEYEERDIFGLEDDEDEFEEARHPASIRGKGKPLHSEDKIPIYTRSLSEVLRDIELFKYISPNEVAEARQLAVNKPTTSINEANGISVGDILIDHPEGAEDPSEVAFYVVVGLSGNGRSVEVMSLEENRRRTDKGYTFDKWVAFYNKPTVFVVKQGTSKPTSSRPAASKSDKGAIMDDSTMGKRAGETIESPVFDTMAKKARKALQGLGFKNVSEFKNFIGEHQDSFPKLDTITTQEQFDTVLENIKDGCYK